MWQVDKAVDKAVVVEMGKVENKNIDRSEPQLLDIDLNRWEVMVSDIPVHVDTLNGKANNMIRILFENVDGFVVLDKTDKNNNKNKYK